MPVIRVSKAKTYLGAVTYKRKRTWYGKVVISDFKLCISARYELSESLLEDTIIHEMIHYYILYNGLKDIEQVFVNGSMDRRVAGNLNISFAYVEGESLMMALKDLAVSSGSACTSASLEPSYVLRALGLNDELAHSSIRFSIGRFTTEEEIDYAIGLIRNSIGKLRDLSPLWDMYKEGIDLSKVEWVSH